MSRFSPLPFFALAAFLGAGVAFAQPVAVNVGSSEFTVFWESDTGGSPDVRVFTDATETNEITGSLRREAFPLAESPRPHWSAERRNEIRDLRETIRQRGLQLVRVGALEGGGTYYFRAGMRDQTGTFQPVSGAPVEVTTAPETGFVSDFRQAAFTFEPEDEGSVAILRTAGSRSPLLAIVGDSSGNPETGVFPLGALIDDATGAPLDTSGGIEFEVTHVTGSGDSGTMAVPDGAAAGDFEVAGLSTRSFQLVIDVDVAYFEFDPVDDQLAGQPFMVRVTARTADDAIASDFAGAVTFSSDGRLETGGASGAFTGGVLDDHAVVIGTTGDYDLTATYDGNGASGRSNEFTVRTDWENWASVYGDPDLEDASLREQRLADPESTGMPGIFRYAFEIDPNGTRGRSPAELSVDPVDGKRFANITFRRLQYAPDVRYVVWGSDDLESWEALHVIEPGVPEWVTVYDQVPIDNVDARFLRVEVVGDQTFRFWRVDGFPAAEIGDPDVSGPNADPGDLGVTNLERYALGMDAEAPDLEALPTRSTVEEGGETFNQIEFERLPESEDVRYVVEATSDYPNWVLVQDVEPGEPTTVSVRDPTPVPEDGYRLLRLRVEPVVE